VNVLPIHTEWKSEVPRTPDEAGAYWWWNGDEDSGPIHIEIMYSPTSQTCFAPMGQWGWNTPQETETMGGLWKKLLEPELPSSPTNKTTCR
jgi:hypothetical protein